MQEFACHRTGKVPGFGSVFISGLPRTATPEGQEPHFLGSYRSAGEDARRTAAGTAALLSRHRHSLSSDKYYLVSALVDGSQRLKAPARPARTACLQACPDTLPRGAAGG